MSGTARLKRVIRYTHGFASLTSISSIIASAVAGQILLLVVLGVVEPQYIDAMLTVALILLLISLALTTLDLFTPLFEFLQYPLRMVQAFLLVFATLGAMAVHAYMQGRADSLKWAFLTIIVYLASLVIIYGHYFRKGARGEHIVLHKNAIEKVTGAINRAAEKIRDKKTLEELLEASRIVNQTWARVIKKEFVERGDASKAFVQALYVAGVYYACGYPAEALKGTSTFLLVTLLLALVAMMAVIILDVYTRSKAVI